MTTYARIPYDDNVALVSERGEWRAVDHVLGHRTRGYDSLEELNAALCDGTAGWTVP